MLSHRYRLFQCLPWFQTRFACLQYILQGQSFGLVSYMLTDLLLSNNFLRNRNRKTQVASGPRSPPVLMVDVKPADPALENESCSGVKFDLCHKKGVHADSDGVFRYSIWFYVSRAYGGSWALWGGYLNVCASSNFQSRIEYSFHSRVLRLPASSEHESFKSLVNTFPEVIEQSALGNMFCCIAVQNMIQAIEWIRRRSC